MQFLFQGLIIFLILASSHGKTVTISNVVPIRDSTGQIRAGSDGNFIQWQANGLYYYYTVDYGPCVIQPQGCTSMNVGTCGFMLNHTIKVYTSEDLSSGSWKLVTADALPISGRPNGIYFRPVVVYNPNTKLYVFWANVLLDGTMAKSVYMAATSPNPEGPFKTVAQSIQLKHGPGGGDFGILVDDDGVGYLFYSAIETNYWHKVSIEQLAPDFLSSLGATDPTKSSAMFPYSGCDEATQMIKRNGVYFALYGRCCCFCAEGANLQVYTSDKPLGPYTFRGDIDADSNGASTLRAQQNGIFTVKTVTGTEYIWVGERWQSAPDKLKNHDFQFFSPLTFINSTTIAHLKWIDSFTLDLA